MERQPEIAWLKTGTRNWNIFVEKVTVTLMRRFPGTALKYLKENSLLLILLWDNVFTIANTCANQNSKAHVYSHFFVTLLRIQIQESWIGTRDVNENSGFKKVLW
jgi:hypothetical protein